MQYKMPDAYDEDGGVNQEKRFAVALQRYRFFSLSSKLDTHSISATIQDRCAFHKISRYSVKLRFTSPLPLTGIQLQKRR